jgi:hypothetical protein
MSPVEQLAQARQIAQYIGHQLVQSDDSNPFTLSVCTKASQRRSTISIHIVLLTNSALKRGMIPLVCVTQKQRLVNHAL